MDLIQAANEWLATLHPHMVGVDVVQLASATIVSWLGMRAICGSNRHPQERTLAEVQEILQRANRRRRE